MTWKKISDEVLAQTVKESLSVSEVIRKLGYARVDGGTHAHITKRIKSADIDKSHFLGQARNRGAVSHRRKNFGDVLIYNRLNGRKEDRFRLHRSLQELGMKYECVSCQLGPEWNGNRLTLQIDHIDGNPLNNLKENLRYLCPNCHSQTDTFGTKNIKICRSGEIGETQLP